MPYRLTFLSALVFAWGTGVALAADDPVATAPIPPASQAQPAAAPQKPLFVAPTVAMPKKPAANPAASQKAAATSTRHRAVRSKTRVFVARAKPPVPRTVHHVRRERPQYYARVYPSTPSPYYEAPEIAEGPPMAPPAWYNRGFAPEYPYPGFRRW